MNHDLLFLYSLTLDDLLFTEEPGVKLSEQKEIRCSAETESC